LENPSTRVYSSPNPTHPESSTIGEFSSSPQKLTRRGCGIEAAAAFMGRALYDACPCLKSENEIVIKTSLPLLLLLASGLAQPADKAPSERAIFTHSDLLPGAVDPGYETLPWPDDADVQSGPNGVPLERWTAQAEAGRARAAAIVGRYWLERIAESPENCAKAIDWYSRADKLGSNEAPAWLGHLYRRLDCPQRNVKTAIGWLRKAVPLASYGAAADLFALFADTTTPEADAALAVAYGRVAAAGNEFAAGDDAETRLATLEQGLDARQKKTASELADKLLADVARRREALTAAPREEKLKVGTSGAGWKVNLLAYDELRECAANTIGNCKGVRRAVYFEAANDTREYLRCKFALDHRDFALGTANTNERETLLPPDSSRRLFAGRVGEIAGPQDLRVSCAPVAGLAANVAANKCRLATTGIPSVAEFYPPGAKRRNEEGRVVLNIWMDQKEGHPSLVELRESSGFPELDMAGVKMGSYMAFKGDCDQGYTSVAIAFRLAD
jgi:TonB family protein